MVNIIQSDIFRLKKGKTLRVAAIVMAAIIVVMLAIFMGARSDGFAQFLEITAETDSAASAEETGTVQGDIADIQEVLPENAAEFAAVIMEENPLPFFFLPIIIAIFCADFSYMTYRNTLSYESRRTKVYLAKLLLSIIICFLFQIFTLLSCWLIGGIGLGFGGFSAEYFLRMAVSMLLLFAVQLGIICFGHCVIAYVKRSGAAIGTYIGALLGVTMVIQIITIIPQLQWVSYLDWSSAGSYLVSYWNAPIRSVVLPVGAGILVAAASTGLGISHFRKADLTL